MILEISSLGLYVVLFFAEAYLCPVPNIAVTDSFIVCWLKTQNPIKKCSLTVIATSNLSIHFGSQQLFRDVNIKFIPGNCYGLIGANGAGKSTFLKILSGEIEPTLGQVIRAPGQTLSVLRQDHFVFDEVNVLETVMQGNEKLFAVIKEKNALYAKADFSEKDGERASELEGEFAELNGWEAESNAALMLAGLGIGTEHLTKLMKELTGAEKIKVLLAQALFGEPDVLLLDEPTNHLDIFAIRWLEEFLMKSEKTVIVVSHDRHFMNKVCTHIADVDFKKITAYSGNYEFWKRSSELAMRLKSDEKRKAEDKAEDLKRFIARFSANASKSRQTTSRQKQLEKLNLDDLPTSSRREPFVGFEIARESGKEVLKIESLSKTLDGVVLLNKINLELKRGDKIALVGASDVSRTTLLKILVGELEADQGSFALGSSIKLGYLPVDNSALFTGEKSLIDWLHQYSPDPDESFLRGWLGRMLFSRDDVFKKTNVLSGGERMRCVLSKLMLAQPNLLLLDEPTSHLDLEAVSALNDGLQRYKGTLIFTSHDHELVNTVADRIVEINDDGTIAFDKYISYDEYVDLKRDQGLRSLVRT
jgi:ATPase subunit of ABC transporter with duplicated ATPase domains